jgi:hypothetical protein
MVVVCVNLGAHVADGEFGSRGGEGSDHVLLLERAWAKRPGHEEEGAPGCEGPVVLVEGQGVSEEVARLTHAQVRLPHLDPQQAGWYKRRGENPPRGACLACAVAFLQKGQGGQQGG